MVGTDYLRPCSRARWRFARGDKRRSVSTHFVTRLRPFLAPAEPIRKRFRRFRNS